MKHVVLPTPKNRRLIFYLAMEEYLARVLKEEGFFMWQVDPTVIFGRNQLMENEVNLSYCKHEKIQLYRRKSGGGCVYSDRGNIMLSYITRGDNVGFLFDCFLRRLAFILKKMGVNAEVSGRNDIVIEGRKVSGNAFYKTPENCIVHGTLLFDSDFEKMQKAITPSTEKMESKGVESVRSRVTNLREYTDMDIEDFKQYVISEFCRDGELRLTDEDVKNIESIEQTYLDDDFFKGKNPVYTVKKHHHLKGVGEVSLNVDLKNEVIRQIRIEGDYFSFENDVEKVVNNLLRGVKMEQKAVEDALKNFDMTKHIMGFSTTQFIEILVKP